MKGGRLALGRLKVGAMNKTEASYEQDLRDAMTIGDVLWYRFEGVKLRLADNTFYTPDFAVMVATGQMEMHEVKGHPRIFEDDAKVKIKVAAQAFPFRFIAVFPRSKKEGGGWMTIEY